MADFVAVIRKAVDNLSDKSPENRAKVYEKARSAIRRQLEAMTPRPTDEMIDRQISKLDEAIAEVDSEYLAALPADADETKRLMDELEALVEEKGSPSAGSGAPAPTPPAPQVQAPPVAMPPVPEPSRAGFGNEHSAASARLPSVNHDEAFGLGEAPRYGSNVGGNPDRATGPNWIARQLQRSGSLGWVTLLAILLLVAVAGYAGWSQKDAFLAMFSGDDTETTTNVSSETGVAGGETPENTAAESSAEDASTEVAAVEPNQSVAEDDGKFTQRLGPDGTETDPGPSPSTSDAGPVEGRSVAAQTGSGEAPRSDEPGVDGSEGTDTAEEQPDEPGALAETDQPLGVVQKMFLYEERLDQQTPAVTEGTVAWSAISDPDNGGPNNLAIRGEISTSDGFTALMTIKKNTDQSLPASHIIEVVFALSPEFPGGSIDQLQRVSMKQTEQDQGNPLVAVPAKITSDFYMVALNDLAEAVDSNLLLLRDRNWIDIPVVYNNGRRALITIEKGATGSEVFNQVLDVWAAG